ncbi:hypothetical protein TIFTF001_020505 [Ficus carica]|uniref:Uncharacterized protein n=1 Tax=Ficus carica TaxID=3494 RepID=A0AA88DJL9_FICCA|nr:hypothetical protein TIFTF001_020505 [Ficus carica]
MKGKTEDGECKMQRVIAENREEQLKMIVNANDSESFGIVLMPLIYMTESGKFPDLMEFQSWNSFDPASRRQVDFLAQFYWLNLTGSWVDLALESI